MTRISLTRLTLQIATVAAFVTLKAGLKPGEDLKNQLQKTTKRLKHALR